MGIIPDMHLIFFANFFMELYKRLQKPIEEFDAKKFLNFLLQY